MTTQTATTPMPRLISDVEEARRELTRRRGFEEPDLSPRMQEGIRRVFGADLSADEVVDRILSDVRNEGDAAIVRYSAAFDGEAPASLEIPRTAWKAALSRLDPALQDGTLPGRRANRGVSPQAVTDVLARLQRRWRAGSGRASARSRRRLHPGRDSGLSLVAADDRRTGARRRRAGDHRLHTAWAGRGDLAVGAGGRRSGRGRSRLWHRWSAGHRGDGVWH